MPQTKKSTASLWIYFLGATIGLSQSTDPQDLPLIQANNIAYLGSFDLPSIDQLGNRLTYAGKGLGYNPENNSIFMQCHDHEGGVTEFSIPEFGQTATILQPCTDILEGHTVDNDVNGTHISGNLVYEGRLITTQVAWYDADNTQRTSHGVSANLDFSDTNNFSGFFPFAADVVAYPRALSGYMGHIPSQWWDALGGPAVTGQAAVSIISSSSDGPALTVFDPAEVGLVDSLNGTTLLFYPTPQVHPDFGANGSQIAGVAFPRGSRSVLFWGTRALHPYCYGSNHDCPYSCFTHQGPHNQFRHTIWAYDVNDLLEVKSGDIDPWEVLHYARWEWDDIHTDSCASANFGGATFDHDNGVLYVTERYGEHPAIHAFKITLADCTENPLWVTSAEDTGTGSLRALLADACPGDTIRFSLDVEGDTIHILSEELLINQSIHILSSPIQEITIRSDSQPEVLHIAPDAVVKISGLSIVGGTSVALLNEGLLTLENVTLHGQFESTVGSETTLSADLTIQVSPSSR